MIWFGSSAGVALANQFPEARSVGAWLRGRLACRRGLRRRLRRHARCCWALIGDRAVAAACGAEEFG